MPHWVSAQDRAGHLSSQSTPFLAGAVYGFIVAAMISSRDIFSAEPGATGNVGPSARRAET